MALFFKYKYSPNNICWQQQVKSVQMWTPRMNTHIFTAASYAFNNIFIQAIKADQMVGWI